ncbi:uncharacterized protein MELLADRAFT_108875 [Melampsora larici-populina 98AG31]|uniref:START domain-containing protein n=1 Tax=Melampsora larici-populina (strain 98AG31 / pathotype 3-4-7) TaxID=747676 RepID=F4RUK7_MELLP|nr:uncharacterized protein MELLADRAFT_108875 [Melampsora larici-populina 98AG31]EGG03977.1 hypothetical protein MELLADRAFT_108875 [Melampsora larici-populina 98AG31]
MDGSFEQTHQRYQDTLNKALSEFKSLLSSNQSNQWKPIPPTATQVNPHTPFLDSKPNPRELLNGIVLNPPKLRGMWDNLVDKAQGIEVFDSNTRIVKTDFRLGWLENPRDSITITKTFHEFNTIIDTSTSLLPSVDEPVYLSPTRER